MAVLCIDVIGVTTVPVWQLLLCCRLLRRGVITASLGGRNEETDLILRHLRAVVLNSVYPLDVPFLVDNRRPREGR